MVIICRVCKRKMDFEELSGTLGIRVLKFFGEIFGAILLQLALAKIQEKIQTRSGEGIMTSVANQFGVACPACKASDTPWDPYYEINAIETADEIETGDIESKE